MPHAPETASPTEPPRWSSWKMALMVLGSAFGAAPSSGSRSPVAVRRVAK